MKEDVFHSWLTHDSWVGLSCRTGWKIFLNNFPKEHHQHAIQLLSIIDAPGTLLGLDQALNSISYIFSDLSKSSKYKDQINDRWLPLIADIRNVFEGGIDTEYSEYKQTYAKGILTKNPLYSCLLEFNGDQSNYSRYIAFPIIWLLLNLLNSTPQERKKHYPISKEIRRPRSKPIQPKIEGLNAFDGGSIILQAYKFFCDVDNEDSEKPKTYNTQITKEKVSSYIASLGKFKLSNAKFIIKNGVSNDEQQSSRSHSSGKPFGSKIIGRDNQVSISLNSQNKVPTEMNSDELGNFSLESFINCSVLMQKEPWNQNLDPQDFALNTVIKIPIEGINRSRRKIEQNANYRDAESDRAKRKVNAKYLADSVIRSNQRFLTNTSIMDDFTLEVLIKEITRWSEQSNPDIIQNRLEIHPVIASTVLASCLFTGSSLEDVVKKTNAKSLDNSSQGYFLNKNKDAGFWILESPLAGMIKQNYSNNYTESVNYIYRLPIPKWLTTLITTSENIRKQYFEYSETENNELKSVKGVSQLGFLWTIEDYQKTYGDFFKKIRQKYPGIEINLSHVENYLLNSSLQSLDWVYSAYFTGKNTLFSHTQLYYSRLSEDEIHSKYAQFWEGKLLHVSYESIELQALLEFPKIKTNRFVGSAFVPKLSFLKALVVQLQQNLISAPIKSMQDVFNYHQTYTIYTMFFLSYATGYRGVHEILPSWRLISDDQKWLAISDKDDQDSTHTRITFLAQPIRKHLALYLDHINRLLSKVLLLDYALYELMVDQIRDAENKLEYRNKVDRFVNDKDVDVVFFHINVKKRSFEPLSLNYFFSQLHSEQNILIPANGGRHLIRTTALNRGIPCDLLDAFLGHSIYGNEPHSPYSSLNLSEIEHAFEPMITDLLNEINLKPIKSKL